MTHYKPAMLFLNVCAYGVNRVNARGHALTVYVHAHGCVHCLFHPDARDDGGYLYDYVGDHELLQYGNGNDSDFQR